MTRALTTPCWLSSGRRSRTGGLEQAPLDALLERLSADGLVKVGGKQRTDSTHVVAAVAALNRLELAGENVRAAVEALDVPGWTRKYGTPVTDWHPPTSKKKQDELAITCARDGYGLLRAVYDKRSPACGSGHAPGCPAPAVPNIITHVATTDATVTDNAMTGPVDDALAAKNMAPALGVAETRRHGIALISPLLADTSAQAQGQERDRGHLLP